MRRRRSRWWHRRGRERGVTSTPAIVDGTIYIGDWAGVLRAYAFDTGDDLRGSTTTGPDADVGAAPNLLTIGDRDVVGVGDKAGVYSVLDRDNGETVWATMLTEGSHLRLGRIMQERLLQLSQASPVPSRSPSAWSALAVDGQLSSQSSRPSPSPSSPGVPHPLVKSRVQGGASLRPCRRDRDARSTWRGRAGRRWRSP